MPKHQLRIKQPLQPLDHLQTLDPRVVIPGQPAVRVTQLVVLRNVELIRRPDPRAALLQIHLHDDQPRGMARTVVKSNPLIEIEVVFSEGIPLQLVQRHVSRQIDAEVRARADGPARVLEFLFVHVDGHVGVHEVFEAAGVVEVQVADYHGFDVFNVVACGFYRGGQLLRLAVRGAREEVG